RDRPAGPEHDIAVRGDELSDIVDLERAVAGIALTTLGLHSEEGVAVDDEIERIVGLLGGALREVVPGGTVLHEADLAIGADEVVLMRVRAQEFFENRFLGLEPRRIDVGKIVRDHVELTLERDLLRQSDEKRVLHRRCSPETGIRTALPQAFRIPSIAALPSRGSWGEKRKPCQR